MAEPYKLRKDLRKLRAELLADPYFRDVPSMQPESRKTAILFHAKDDRPEVRREVFKLLLRHDIKFYAVVRNKQTLPTWVGLDFLMYAPVLVEQRLEKQTLCCRTGNLFSGFYESLLLRLDCGRMTLAIQVRGIGIGQGLRLSLIHI